MKKVRLLVAILIVGLILGAMPSSFGMQKVLAEKSTRDQIKEKEQERYDRICAELYLKKTEVENRWNTVKFKR